LLYEFKADLNAYLAGLGPSAPVRSLKDVIDFNEKNRDREMPYFGQDIMIRSQEKGPLTDRKYLAALRKNHLLTRTRLRYQKTPARRADCTDRRTAMAHRLVERRSLQRRLLVSIGSRGLSAHHRACGLHSRSTGRHLVLRRRVHRADADQDCLRLRASDKSTADAAVSADGQLFVKKSPYSVHPGVLMTRKWIGELKQKTGRSLDEWLKHIKKSGPADEADRRVWLKEEHNLGIRFTTRF
jgi:hypothetical protein